MKTHRVIAQPWQLNAVQENRLSAVIKPLAEWSLAHCVVQNIGQDGWIENSLKGEQSPHIDFAKDVHIEWQTGDRIYLAEEWAECRDFFDGSIHGYETKSQIDAIDPNEWQFAICQPAEEMPPEAAQYWFEVTEVKVTQAKYLDYFTIGKTGFYNSYPDATYPSEEFKNAWDKAHPEHLWSGNLSVIVLEVRAINP
jgi:hypothetical protein